MVRGVKGVIVIVGPRVPMTIVPGVVDQLALGMRAWWDRHGV